MDTNTIQNTPPSGATIPVKKSDGTVVRMTLEEFKTYRAGLAKETANIAPKNVPEPKTEPMNQPAVLPAVPTPSGLSTVAPVKEIFVDEVKAKMSVPVRRSAPTPSSSSSSHPYPSSPPPPPPPPPPVITEKKDLKKSENASLLEDTPPPAPTVSMAVSSGNETDEDVKKIIGEVKSRFSPEEKRRAEILIKSFLKGIRSEDDVRHYASKPKHQGGLGLTPEDAEKIATAAVGVFAEKYSESRAKPKPSPLLSRPPVSSVSKPMPPRQNLARPASAPVSFGPAANPPVPSGGWSASRPAMHDVVPPEKERISGPVDELRIFSLADFRRLSATAPEAGRLILEKFENLKKDSFLFFLQGRLAWFQSPLYHKYQEAIRAALERRFSVRQAIALDTESLNMEEFESLLEIGKVLDK